MRAFRHVCKQSVARARRCRRFAGGDLALCRRAVHQHRGTEVCVKADEAFMTSTVRARTASSGVVIESPFASTAASGGW